MIKVFAGVPLDMMPVVAHREIVVVGIAAHCGDVWSVYCCQQKMILVNGIHADIFDMVLVVDCKADISPGRVCCASDEP